MRWPWPGIITSINQWVTEAVLKLFHSRNRPGYTGDRDIAGKTVSQICLLLPLVICLAKGCREGTKNNAWGNLFFFEAGRGFGLELCTKYCNQKLHTSMLLHRASCRTQRLEEHKVSVYISARSGTHMPLSWPQGGHLSSCTSCVNASESTMISMTSAQLARIVWPLCCPELQSWSYSKKQSAPQPTLSVVYSHSFMSTLTQTHTQCLRSNMYCPSAVLAAL